MSDKQGLWGTLLWVLRDPCGFRQEVDLSVLQRCFCRDLGQAVAVFGFNLPSSLPSPAAVQLWDGDLSLMAWGGLM